jgi:hypothetical protein
VASAAVVVFFYPLERSRYAAYGVLFPLFLFVALWLVPSFRRSCRLGYERLAYWWRVGVGGLGAPALIYLVIVLSFIPPSFRPKQRFAVAPDAAKAPGRVFLLSLPRELDRSETKAGNETIGNSLPTFKESDNARLVNELPEANEAPQANSMIPSERAWPELYLSELPPIPLPEQPFPSIQEFTANTGIPAVPSNLRITQ